MSPLTTPWGETLDAQRVLPEYPRPQMVRASYINLNGTWDCSFVQGDTAPTQWQPILVPFSPEAPLSGVGRALKPVERLWYRRELPVLSNPGQGRVLLHFGAVDQQADVYVNGKHVAQHTGGYTPFSADITDALTEEPAELRVCVQDDTDASWQSRGKQRTKRGKIWYTPQSGIWQTVWMERVPSAYITGLTITPLFEMKAVRIVVHCSQPMPCTLTLADTPYTFESGTPFLLTPNTFHPWSPEDPYLYSFTVTAGSDLVSSYFALRSIHVETDESGIRRLFLNGKPYFQTGLLDQGYWPDGLYTAPSDEAMVADIRAAREMGFNMLRKHLKVEPLRWYYHCDRLGMLVWQDMVNGGHTDYNPLVIRAPMITGIHLRDHHYRIFGRTHPEGRAQYNRELEETVRLLYNSPCVVLWVAFNEGLGQFDAAKAVQRIRSLDVTRPIDHASGWHDQGIGEFKSVHFYYMRYRFRPDKLGRAVILSEFGGYNLRIPDHVFNDRSYGYKELTSPEAFAQAIGELYEEQILPAKAKGLCAAVYTQLTDVEDEVNGLLTYDRRVMKIPSHVLYSINSVLRRT